MRARSTLESTSSKARSRSREGVAMDEAPRISPRLPSNHRRRHRRHCHQSSQRSRVHQHARLQRQHSRMHQSPRCQRQSKMRDGEPRDSKRRYDTLVGFAPEGKDRKPVTEG